MSTTPSEPAKSRIIHDRVELYLDADSQPNALLYRWRFRSGANGNRMAHGAQPYSRRVDALAAAEVVVGATLRGVDPSFTEQQPGQDGDVTVWLVDRRSRRGFPEGGSRG